MKATPPKPTPDLLIAPQTGTYIPNEHLTPTQQQQVKEAWKAWGNTPPPNPSIGTWTVAILHIINDVPTITTVRQIPKLLI